MRTYPFSINLSPTSLIYILFSRAPLQNLFRSTAYCSNINPSSGQILPTQCRPTPPPLPPPPSFTYSFHELPFRICLDPQHIVPTSILPRAKYFLHNADPHHTPSPPLIPIVGYEEAISYYFILMGLISSFHVVKRLFLYLFLLRLT